MNDGVPRCVACDYELTVEHIPIDCGDFSQVRQRYYDANKIIMLRPLYDNYYRKIVTRIAMCFCVFYGGPLSTVAVSIILLLVIGPLIVCRNTGLLRMVS